MRIGRVFYFEKREHEIYKEMLENVKCMIQGAKYLEKSIFELRGTQHDEDVSKAIEYERVCDINIKHITEKIIKLKHSRRAQDLFILNQRLESVSKAVEGASHRVQMSRGIRLPDYLNEGLKRMVVETVKTVEALELALNNMPDFPDEVLKHIQEVHVHEENMDDIRRKSCGEFAHSTEEMPIQKFYIWNEIVTKMEMVSDNCESAAQIIGRILASRE